MIVTPWITPDDLPTPRPDLPPGATWEDLCGRASALLYRLSGGRWAGVRERTLPIVAPPSVPSTPGEWDLSWGVCSGTIGHASCGTTRTVRLPDYPVVELLRVESGGVEVDASTYRLDHRRFLTSRSGWSTCGTSLLVTYRHGEAPPADARAAAADLALALGEQLADPSRSRLPGLTTSITRQGVSITQQPGTEVVAAGRTGLFPVDLWLSSVNPTGRRSRSRAWSPDTAPR